MPLTADVMDKELYKALSLYYNVLEKTGYISSKQSDRLLVFLFYRDLLYNDFRGYLSMGDYHLIESALDCLFGSSCLLPYSDYSLEFTRKGDDSAEGLPAADSDAIRVSEIDFRLRNLENTNVLKLMPKDGSSSLQSDIDILVEN